MFGKCISQLVNSTVLLEAEEKWSFRACTVHENSQEEVQDRAFSSEINSIKVI